MENDKEEPRASRPGHEQEKPQNDGEFEARMAGLERASRPDYRGQSPYGIGPNGQMQESARRQLTYLRSMREVEGLKEREQTLIQGVKQKRRNEFYEKEREIQRQEEEQDLDTQKQRREMRQQRERREEEGLQLELASIMSPELIEKSKIFKGLRKK